MLRFTVIKSLTYGSEHDLGLLRSVWLTQELEHLLHFDVSLTVRGVEPNVAHQLLAIAGIHATS